MPRSFDLAATYGCSVAEVLTAFSDKRYWLKRLELSGCDETSLDVLDADDHAGIRIVTTQTVRLARLPKIVTQVHRGDLTLVREESWTPLRDGRSSADISAKMLGTPARVRADAELADEGSGARGTVHVTVEVKIPLLGGQLENQIGGQLVDLLRLEQEFTDKWVNDHS
ncbi:DUF2505 domain-containing protein [Mycobacterium sp. C31M]